MLVFLCIFAVFDGHQVSRLISLGWIIRLLGNPP